MKEKLKDFKVILASASPRRQYLLKKLGLEFDVRPVNVDETYLQYLKAEQIAVYLAELKAGAFNEEDLDDQTLVITADTVVWHRNSDLAKPAGYKHAYQMLKQLSGDKHEVITGVCIRSKDKQKTFFASTTVHFKQLSDEVIDYYLKKFKPFDKAGAYGIQEWIGYVGIDRIEGSFFNVVGLPVEQLFDKLLAFVEDEEER
ncbi:MAG: Maf family nucleotide pyrophosphatase [Bacteroidales bacterium]|nr:Maf family nucleotide pyrophosphatase [Bacteroidales bacterium]